MNFYVDTNNCGQEKRENTTKIRNSSLVIIIAVVVLLHYCVDKGATVLQLLQCVVYRMVTQLMTLRIINRPRRRSINHYASWRQDPQAQGG